MRAATNGGVMYRDHLVAVADQIADEVLAHTLAKSRWTHEAHLLACLSLVRRLGAVETLAVLRRAIPLYNETTGVDNTDTSGYHDTLTVYYVWAVDRLLATPCTTTDVLHDPLVDRQAALKWWDKSTLFSVSARRKFVPPTLVHDGANRPGEPA